MLRMLRVASFAPFPAFTANGTTASAPLAAVQLSSHEAGMGRKQAAALIALISLGGCHRYPMKVAGPFYLDEMPDTYQIALYRCPDGPDKGCAIDDIPVMSVIAAGGNDNFVTVQTDKGFYYFQRVDRERRGWGLHPEMVVGPYTETDFEGVKQRHHLPELTVRP